MSTPARRTWLDRLLAWWRALPLVFVALLVTAMARPIWVMLDQEDERAVERDYPLSHFPMYSNFDEADYVVFLADGSGQPLPQETVTGGLRVARIKKFYNEQLNNLLEELDERTGEDPGKLNAPLELKREAGQRTLNYLVSEWRIPANLAKYPKLQLYYQEIGFRHGQVGPSEPLLVAEWFAEGAAATTPAAPAP